MTAKWFDNFQSTYKTKLDKGQIKEILHIASFADGSNKVYFYQNENGLIAELNDRTISNIDNITISNIDNISLLVSADGEGTIDDKVIIAVDSLSSLNLSIPEIQLEVIKIGNKIKTFEALLFTCISEGVLVKYLFNSKMK